jgi:protein-disulfide isomerase
MRPLAHRRANATLLLQDRNIRHSEPALLLTRRTLIVAAPFGFAFAGLTGITLPPLMRPARADDAVSPADLAAAAPDGGDIMIGSDTAPVTIIEYASMTCPHCAHFSETTFPELQKRYIDTGKVKFTLRPFPLDQLAAAGFMLALCGGKDKYMPMVETLFAKQADWIVREPVPPLKEISKQYGITETQFNECLANQKLLNSIQATRDQAAQKLGVNSTPTFFVNGKKLVGDVSIDQMSKEIDPYLKSG